jgi:GH24 family phage-related lysozyme (muramidase)
MEIGYSETQPGGIPLGIISIPILDENGIPLKDNTGKVITFQPVTKDSYSSSGLYIPRYSNQVGIMQPAILTGGLNTSDFAEYFKKQSEENLGYLPAVRNSLLFPAGVSSSSEKQTTEFLRNPYFWGEITEDTLEYRVGLFKQFLESEEIPNSNITSVNDLVVLLNNNPTLLSKLSAGDFYFSDIPDPVITRAVQHFADDKGLFNKNVMQTTFEKGKSLGLKTLDQYLSLMFTVASQYSDNRQDDFGYNYREAVKDPNFDVNNPPSRKSMGSDKQGLILYRPTAGSFSYETAELVRNGYNIYQSKTNSQEFYAFSSDEFANDVVNFDEFSPVYIIRYKADEQQQQQSLDTAIPNTQTPEKIQTVVNLPGWYGWSPSTGTSSATQPTKKILEDTFVGPPDTTGAAEEFLSEWNTRKNKLFGINTNEQQDAMFAGMFGNKDTQKKSQYDFKTKSNLGRQWQNFKDKMSTLLPDIKKKLDTMENWKNETPVGQLEQERIQSARDAGTLVREMLEKLKGEPLGEYNPLTGEGGIEGLIPQPQQLLKLPLVPFLLTWEYLFNNQTTSQNDEPIKQLQPTIDDIKSKTLTEEELKTLGIIDSIMNNFSFPDAITSIPEDLNRQWQNLLDKTDASPGAVSGNNKPDVEQATIQITEAKFPGVWNSDGSMSNIRTISFQETKDGPHIVIPTIKKGRVMTDEEAIKEYQNTKEHFGIFSTVEKATKHATELHNIEEAKGKQLEKTWMSLISFSEGMETKAYNKDGKWTIGKGSTTHPDGRPVKKGDVITLEQADLYARHYVYTKVIPQLRTSIPTWYEMNSNQQAAIISFAYNVGEYFYNRVGFETITKALKTKNNWGLVPSALPLYNKGMDLKLGKKRVLDGLIKRRKKEAELWLQAPTTISEGK